MSCEPVPFSIYQGDAKTMKMKAVYAGQGADPLDLTSCTEIVVNLPKADGTTLQLKKSLNQVVIDTPVNLGKFEAAISSVNSALLNPGALQNFDVTFTIGSDVFTVPYLAALSVFEQ